MAAGRSRGPAAAAPAQLRRTLPVHCQPHRLPRLGQLRRKHQAIEAAADQRQGGPAIKACVGGCRTPAPPPARGWIPSRPASHQAPRPAKATMRAIRASGRSSRVAACSPASIGWVWGSVLRERGRVACSGAGGIAGRGFRRTTGWAAGRAAACSLAALVAGQPKRRVAAYSSSVPKRACVATAAPCLACKVASRAGLQRCQLRLPQTSLLTQA